MSSNDDCRLITSKEVRSLLGNISAMGLWRYTNDPKLGFPQPIKIGARNLWRARELRDWIDQMAAKGPVKGRRPGAAGEAA